jgi:hypothetical protein
MTLARSLSAALLSLPFLVGCSNYNGTGRVAECSEMHNDVGAIEDLNDEIARLEKEVRKLSKNPEQNAEQIRGHRALIAQKEARKDALLQRYQQQASGCEPMFEDPAQSRAERSRY